MRLIDADELKDLEELEYTYFKTPATVPFYEADKVWEILDNAPTIDPESLRPKGRWITHTVGHGKYANNYVECSECHTVGSPKWKCCPVCEAKMEG